MDFAKVLRLLADYFRRERQPFALAGALALHAYGLSRATADLDLVTSTVAQDALVLYLESLGYETLHRSSGYSNHVHADPEMGRVDVIYVRGETQDRLFATAGTTLLLAGLSLPVPRAEHLAAMKVHAMKNDPRRTLRDLADVQFILSLPRVDETEVRGYFEKAGLLDLYDHLKRHSG